MRGHLRLRLSRVLMAWRDTAQRQRRVRTVAAKVLWRWQHQGVMRCFMVWADNARQLRHTRVTVSRFLQRLLHSRVGRLAPLVLRTLSASRVCKS
jgi:hypothetical protein